jgi:methionyl-tRNA formyltransferase
MRKVLYIGNRLKVFEEITKLKILNIVRIFVMTNSLLQGELKNRSYKHTTFDITDKEYIIKEISKTDFEILISSGCPFIIPVSKVRKPHQLFINTHPSLLPDLGGFHPANGALLYQRKVTGATVHYMDNGLDTGNIIYQEKIDITSDLDLGLIYQMTFDLEAKVFAIGMKRVIEKNFDYKGKSQTGNRSYYTRSEKDMVLDFHSMSNEELITRVKAFGLNSQGAKCVIDKDSYKVFDAETIFNQYLLDKYSEYQCGSLLLKYDGKLLVKTREGIIKINSYRELEQ